MELVLRVIQSPAGYPSTRTWASWADWVSVKVAARKSTVPPVPSRVVCESSMLMVQSAPVSLPPMTR